MGRLTTLFLASILVTCPPGMGVLAQETEGASARQEDQGDSERRVRRLGDVDSDEYELDLSMPTAPRATPEPQNTLSLGDPDLEARLQSALDVLSVSQGDRQAQAEVNTVLDEVLAKAHALMLDGDFEQARELLNVVRQVEPNKSGLSESWEQLAELQKPPPEPVRRATPDAGLEIEPARKENTVTPQNSYRLPNPAQAERLDQLLAMIAARPGHQAALAELDNLLDDLLAQSRMAMQDGDFATAGNLIDVVNSVNPRKRGLSDTRRLLGQTREIDQWLEAARQAEQSGQLIEPRLESAYYHYRRVLSVDSDNQDALRGLRDIQQAMVVHALDAARNYDFELADAWLEEAASIQDDQQAVIEGRRQIERFRGQTAVEIEQEVLGAIRAGDYDLAEFRLIDLIALGGHETRVAELRAMMTREESYGEYEPGQVIQDPFTDGSGYAPAVVVLSKGSFVMGSDDDEDDRSDTEGPVRRVGFERGFALGMQEVTVGQFRTFIESTGYRTEAERQRRGSIWDEELGQLSEREDVNWRHDFVGEVAPDNMPVIHVSWNDALAYVKWLAARTGRGYRLPSEAEYEYAARAGSRTPYWWGKGRPRDIAENLAGQDDQSETGRRFSHYFRAYGDAYFGPAPVGSFEPNPFGLYDMAGNVSEWTQDCWHSSYVRAPNDGSAWDNPGCTRRVVRGGYWASDPRQARSAARMSAPAALKTPQVGIRIARDLW